jgi:hypothetical protein
MVMRSRGQLSFDVIFAFVAFLVLAQFLIGFTDSTSLNESEISVRNQERAIGLKVKSVINSCLNLDFDASNPGDTLVTFRAPLLREITGSTASTNCDILVENNVITVSHLMESGTLSTVTIPLPEYGVSVQPFNCGSVVSFFC